MPFNNFFGVKQHIHKVWKNIEKWKQKSLSLYIEMLLKTGIQSQTCAKIIFTRILGENETANIFNTVLLNV